MENNEKKTTEEALQENTAAEQPAAEEKKKMSKKGKIGIIVGAIVVVLIIVALIVARSMGAIGGISESEAGEIALAQVPGATEENIIAPIQKDYDDGRGEYEVQVVYDGVSYDFTISAKDGSVLSRDIETIGGGQNSQQGSNAQQTTPSSTAGNDIGIDAARETALGQVQGATADNIVSAHPSHDDGRYVYDIEIVYNEMKYDFEIDASNGNILQMDTESVYD